MFPHFQISLHFCLRENKEMGLLYVMIQASVPRYDTEQQYEIK